MMMVTMMMTAMMIMVIILLTITTVLIPRQSRCDNLKICGACGGFMHNTLAGTVLWDTLAGHPCGILL